MPTLILHIDDRPELPDGFVESLAQEGYEFLQITDPEEAIRLVEERPPALVLMEIQLGSCDGLDLLAGIRDPDLGSLPVLVLTRVQRNSGLHGEVIALGVVDFLSKPARAYELMAAIREAVPPPAEAPRQDPSADPAPTDLSGSLADAPVPELLARLRRRCAAGVLIVHRGATHVGIQIRNGSPVAVGSNRRTSGADETSDVSGEEAEQADQQRAEALLFETFRWLDGSYRYVEGRRLKSDSILELDRDPANLMMLGVLDASPLAYVHDRLAKCGTLYASFVAESDSPALEGVDLSPNQQEILENLSGADSLADLLESNAFEEQVLYGLWVAGRIELHVAPTRMLTELVGVDEVEPEPSGDDTAVRPPSGPTESISVSLRKLAQRVMGFDDFEVLDVPIFASDGQVQEAYEQRCREIPEEAFNAPDRELRERAERIRNRIEAAYEHLKDAETRRAYSLLWQEKQQDRDAKPSAERALEGERWFRKGKDLLGAKSYPQAAEAFGMASHLDPGEGEYLAHLGYALYLSNPEQEVVQREAMEHTANGIKRSPNCELSYVFLGRILKGKGDTEAAHKVFRRALRIKPNFHPALQEIRLLEMRARKTGIFSRLRGG